MLDLDKIASLIMESVRLTTPHPVQITTNYIVLRGPDGIVAVRDEEHLTRIVAALKDHEERKQK